MAFNGTCGSTSFTWVAILLISPSTAAGLGTGGALCCSVSWRFSHSKRSAAENSGVSTCRPTIRQTSLSISLEQYSQSRRDVLAHDLGKLALRQTLPLERGQELQLVVGQRREHVEEDVAPVRGT
jgi:hypothetical protein